MDIDLLAQGVSKSLDADLLERAERFNVRLETIFYELKPLGITYKKHSNISTTSNALTFREKYQIIRHLMCFTRG